jgi:regulator of sirC expression with transglutaminase-like and TPR domain
MQQFLSPAHREALARFQTEVHGRPDENINLASAAALLALHVDPTIDIEGAVLAPLNSLGVGFLAHAKEALPAEMPLPKQMLPHALAGLLCEFLSKEGFAGCDRDHYYKVDHSLMNQVLANRRGIPISLSLVYQEVGRLGGLETWGINFPGHFLLAYGSGEHIGLIDAFGNRTLTKPEAANIMSEVTGQSVQVDGKSTTFSKITNLAFLRRMVLNLQNVYSRDGDEGNGALIAHFAHVLVEEAKKRGAV